MIARQQPSRNREHPSERARAAVEAHEHPMPSAAGVIVRYRELWGPDTLHPGKPPPPPRIHVDEAVRLTMPALDASPKSILPIVENSTGSGQCAPAEGP
jgi:hypothetical protein